MENGHVRPIRLPLGVGERERARDMGGQLQCLQKCQAGGGCSPVDKARGKPNGRELPHHDIRCPRAFGEL